MINQIKYCHCTVNWFNKHFLPKVTLICTDINCQMSGIEMKNIQMTRRLMKFSSEKWLSLHPHPHPTPPHPHPLPINLKVLFFSDQINLKPPLDISLWELCQNPIIFRMRKLQNAHRSRLVFLSFLVLKPGVLNRWKSIIGNPIDQSMTIDKH